ncbi:MAG: 2-C-methyl-D-erythritol 4-phosphate cytidylyltransferase [Candidatus Omnitrophica bacterium]|nr:2-C-methyl-D-erythritol 4-phosphate cytidylyltransferase [Candidatus Omnitrophota bacterium]
MKVVALVPAAGKGKRLRGRIDKAFVTVNAKPLVAHTLTALENSPSIDTIILIVGKRSMGRARRMVSRYRFGKVRSIVRGGDTRSDSVWEGLKAVGTHDGIILIHDAARPCISREVIGRAVRTVKRAGAVCVAVPVKPTIKIVRGGSIVTTPRRDDLWEAQTPQVFKRDVIFKAYGNRLLRKSATDDAALAERAGYKVRVVLGDYRNIKVTTREDLILAGQLLKKRLAISG